MNIEELVPIFFAYFSVKDSNRCAPSLHFPETPGWETTGPPSRAS